MSTEDNDYPEPEVDDDEFLTKQDLRDGIDDLAHELDVERARSAKLAKANEQMTMDLILIAATMGAEPNMTVVLSRISELLDREQAYLAMTKGE